MTVPQLYIVADYTPYNRWYNILNWSNGTKTKPRFIGIPTVSDVLFLISSSAMYQSIFCLRYEELLML